jgi:lysophospholipase L1-like esterase
MRGRLYLVGDSRIAQWPLQGPPGWQILRSGFPGQTAPNIAEAMAPLIEAERPELVVIQAGGNDIMAGAFLAEAARPAVVERALAALMAMADRAVAHGARRVVILTVMPPVKPSLMRRMLWGGTVDPGIVALNRAIMALAGPNLSILDVAAVFGPDEDHVKRTYYTNDIHWAPAAYDRLNAALQALLDRDPP